MMMKTATTVVGIATIANRISLSRRFSGR